MAEVVIVGAGIMGCSCALRLAEAGVKTLVLERSVPGAEASSAAAGILAPLVEAHHATSRARPAAALQLGLRSQTLHAELAAQLRDDHGIDVGHRACGAMRVALGDDADLRDHLALVQGRPVEAINGDEARAREPSLSRDVSLALDFPTSAQVEPTRLLPAIALAAERAGASFRSGAFVREVVVEGDRVRGVRVGEERIDADHVIVAAGSWTHLVPGMERELDLRAVGLHPVRGQIVSTRTRPPVFRRVVFGAGGYLVTRPDGRVLCGSTEERVGFRREVTFAGMRAIVDLATAIAPSLADAAIDQHWSSFRPGTSDGLPLVGSAGPDGLWLASGHFRNGILLAPVTAEILRDQITGETPFEAAQSVDPRRFRRAS